MTIKVYANVTQIYVIEIRSWRIVVIPTGDDPRSTDEEELEQIRNQFV